MYMHHSLRVQYPIQRCGTAERTTSIGRRGRLSLLTTRYSPISFESFLSLNLMRCFTTLTTEAQKYMPVTLILAGMYGESIDIGEDPDQSDHTIVVYSP